MSQLSNKKSGRMLHIVDGQYAGKMAIAYQARQEDRFIENRKINVDLFEDDSFNKKIASNILINFDKVKVIGFCD